MELGAGFLAVFAVAAPLAGRERSLPGIAAVLALGQTVLHALFGFGQHGTSTAADSSAALDAALVERAARLVCGAVMATISPARAQRILTDAGLGTSAARHDTRTTPRTPWRRPRAPRRPSCRPCRCCSATSSRPSPPGGCCGTGTWRCCGSYSCPPTWRSYGPRAAVLALVRVLRSGLPGAPDRASRVPHPAREAASELRTTALQHTVIRRGPPCPAAVLALAA